MQAIIYARFSMPGAQAKGDSIPRQMRACEPFCEDQGWTVEAVITDKGRSGFHGHHRLKGNFGDFEREALSGHHIGKVLVVERLDRLSRQDHNKTYDLIRSLTNAGVTVATVQGPRFYRAGETIEFGAMIELLVRLQMSHEESVKKADHSTAKWVARRAKIAEGKPVTALCPAWLRLSEDRATFEVIDGRDAVIRRIFELADSGNGSQRIAQTLNREGVAPWPRFDKREPRAWARGTVLRIMTDVAVIGDYQSHKMADDRRVPVGDPVRGYYPRIVAPDVFARVRSAADDRKGVRGNKGSVPNLVAGLVRCYECGAVMNYRVTRRAGHVRARGGVEQAPSKSVAASLECPTAKDGGCSNRRSIAYLSLERALLNSLLHLALDDSTFERRDEMARLDVQIADCRRDHDIAYQRAVMLFEEADSEMAVMIAKRKEAEAKAISEQIADLQRQREKAAGKASASEHLSRLNALRDHLTHDDDRIRVAARLKIAQAFRQIITGITARSDGCSSVNVLNGKRLLIVRPSVGRREPWVSNFDLVRYDRQHVFANDREREIVEAYLARSIAAKGTLTT